MTPNITNVTVTFSHGIKREEYGPTKKAEVSLTAAVAEDEDGTVVLHQLGRLTIDKVAGMLLAPKPQAELSEQQQHDLRSAEVNRADDAARADLEAQRQDTPPPRRTRGPNKAKVENFPRETEAPVDVSTIVSSAVSTTVEAPAEDEWAVTADDIVITDKELLSALSARAADLGGREQCVQLVSSFANRTNGPPFKAQEIPQNQRKDFMTKLAALTA